MSTNLTFSMTLDILDEDIAEGKLIESDHRLMRHLIRVCGQKRFTFTPERKLAEGLMVKGRPVSHSKITKGIARLRKAGHISTRKTNGNNRIDLQTYIASKSQYLLRGYKIDIA
jgi:hypothetical protein